MPISLTNVQQTEFDTLVKAAYQSEGGLIQRNTVQRRDAVIGRYYDFRKVGYVTSVMQAYQDTVTPQDPNYSQVTCPINKFVTPTLVDEIQELTVNFDARAQQAKIIGFAMMRRSDQIIIDSLSASGTSNSIAADFSTTGTNSNLTYNKMREIARIFDYYAVPPKMRHLAIAASQASTLLDQIQFTNNLYSNAAMNAINNGTLDGSFSMGMNIHVIPFMNEGGLPISGNIRTCFAWHTNSMGMAFGKNMQTEINYVPQNTSWLINGVFSAGGVAIDPVGIINILCDETVTT